MKAFNFFEVNRLPPHREDNLEINLKSGIKPFFEPVYKLLKNKRESLYKYLDSNLASEFIQLL